MGIKSLISLQMIPWPCVPLIWNHISCIHIRGDEEQQQPQPQQQGGGGGGTTTIKVIKSDGLVKIYHKPINASDLMTEFPKHLICHSDSFYIGQKIQALSEKDKLQLGHKYFLLPQHLFQSVLSFVTIASFATASSKSSSQVSPLTTTPSSVSSANSVLTAKVRKNADVLNKVRSCQPFDIRKTASGSLQIRVSDEFISKLMESPSSVKEDDQKNEDEDENRVKQRICNTPQLQKDYSQLVGCSKQWKPKLETISESSSSLSSSSRIRKLGSFSIIHRKNNKKSHHDPSLTQITQRSPDYYHHNQSDLTSKTNVKIIKMSKQSINNNRMICKF
ncbi:hypothetical protein MKW98_014397 [Papaver atlanticum]|uniref:DUF4228 domain-containing protein n=1 Tax=Papaver atlanticum TaxID=357466 RepID=A0AAD4SR94_9MAGN|nr:hypothetical protein MKW98_014397 [Papaver atlanticum]